MVPPPLYVPLRKEPNSAWARRAIVRIYRRNSSISQRPLSGEFRQHSFTRAERRSCVGRAYFCPRLPCDVSFSSARSPPRPRRLLVSVILRTTDATFVPRRYINISADCWHLVPLESNSMSQRRSSLSCSCVIIRRRDGVLLISALKRKRQISRVIIIAI